MKGKLGNHCPAPKLYAYRKLSNNGGNIKGGLSPYPNKWIIYNDKDSIRYNLNNILKDKVNVDKIKKKCLSLLYNDDNKLEDVAASIIQYHWKRYILKYKYGNINKIQANYRGHLWRIKLGIEQRHHLAAAVIQRAWLNRVMMKMIDNNDYWKVDEKLGGVVESGNANYNNNNDKVNDDECCNVNEDSNNESCIIKHDNNILQRKQQDEYGTSISRQFDKMAVVKRLKMVLDNKKYNKPSSSSSSSIIFNNTITKETNVKCKTIQSSLSSPSPSSSYTTSLLIDSINTRNDNIKEGKCICGSIRIANVTFRKGVNKDDMKDIIETELERIIKLRYNKNMDNDKNKVYIREINEVTSSSWCNNNGITLTFIVSGYNINDSNVIIVDIENEVNDVHSSLRCKLKGLLWTNEEKRLWYNDKLKECGRRHAEMIRKNRLLRNNKDNKSIIVDSKMKKRSSSLSSSLKLDTDNEHLILANRVYLPEFNNINSNKVVISRSLHVTHTTLSNNWWPRVIMQ